MFDLDYLVDDFLTSRYEDQHGDPDIDEDNSYWLEQSELSEYAIVYHDDDFFYEPHWTDRD